MEFEITEAVDGQPGVMIDRGQRKRWVPLRAIGVYMEMFGYTDLVDTLEAIDYLREHPEETPVDPVSRENTVTEVYRMLQARESAREAEGHAARQEGRAADPRSPQLRGALAASRACKVDDGGTEIDLLELCRKKARSRKGLREPKRARGNVRARKSGCSQDGDTEEGSTSFSAEERGKAFAALEHAAEQIDREREAYCHELTGNKVDPFAIEAEVVISAESHTVESIADRYRSGGRA